MTKLGRIDMLLLRRAAGNLGPPCSLLIAALLAVSPRARRRLEDFEALGGRLLQEQSPALLSATCLEIVLKSIDEKPE